MPKFYFLLFFFIAASVGAFLRFGIIEFFSFIHPEYALTWGVFIVNILGCYFFGIGLILTQEKIIFQRLLLVAFTGSFTTFSAYIFDMYRFIQEEKYILLLTNTFLQIIIGLLFLRLGMYTIQRFKTKALNAARL